MSLHSLSLPTCDMDSTEAMMLQPMGDRRAFLLVSDASDPVRRRGVSNVSSASAKPCSKASAHELCGMAEQGATCSAQAQQGDPCQTQGVLLQQGRAVLLCDVTIPNNPLAAGLLQAHHETSTAI